jgi:hypothetical protein
LPDLPELAGRHSWNQEKIVQKQNRSVYAVGDRIIAIQSSNDIRPYFIAKIAEVPGY